MNFHIEHVALWCRDLEAMRRYYVDCFGGLSNERYQNQITEFSSYFIRFPGGSTRLELMNKPGIISASASLSPGHFSIRVGSEEGVREMASIIERNGGTILRSPRTTGDGYYEMETLDPEGNRIEIMA